MTTTLSRDELFDKVWSHAVTKVAEELGLSDTAVRKMCRRHNIPVPSRGYWARVAAGSVFPRPKLEPVSNPRLQTITFTGAAKPSPEVQAAAEQLKATMAKPPEATVATDKAAAPTPTAASIPDDEDIHPLVRRTRDKIAAGKPDQVTQVSGKGFFTVTASPSQADRVGLILSKLLHAMDAVGWTAKSDDKGLFLAPGDEPLRFELVEQVRRSRHEKTEAENQALQKYDEALERYYRRRSSFPTRPEIPEWDHVPTGVLVLTLEIGYRHDGLRRKYSDGKTQRLELMIDQIMASLTTYAAGEKVERARQEQQRLEAAEAETRRQEADRRRVLEEKRLEFLKHQLDRHGRAVAVEAFVADAEAAGPMEGAVADFLEWARNYAAAMRADISPEALGRKLERLDLMNDAADLHRTGATDHALEPPPQPVERSYYSPPPPPTPWWYWKR